jgi:F0F1-type ATP synthase assembly protein I
MPPEPPRKTKPLAFGLLVVGSEMASFTVVGVIIDAAAGTMPVFTVVLTMLGLAAAFYHLILMSKVSTKPPQ